MKFLRGSLLAWALIAAGLLISACGSATIQTDVPPTRVSPTSAPAEAPADGGSETALQWSSPPAMEIDPSNTYEAVFVTEAGDFKVRLFAEEAPRTVNSFVFLARQGFFDDTTFHRVLPGFMAQGGDPTGTGTGGPGYVFEDEFHPALQFDRAGVLAMANRGPNTNGSQFFITYGPTPHLNGLHAIFGEVIEGSEIVESLTPRDPLANPNYLGDSLVAVEIIEISD